MKIATPLVLVALLLGSASCGTEQKHYGATTSGPTITSTPSMAADDASTLLPEPETTRRAGGPLCGLFTRAEVTQWLGLPVRRGTSTRADGYRQCTWKATRPPRVPSYRVGDPVLDTDDGIVSITRGTAAQFADLEKSVVTVARSKRAGGRQELPQLGSNAFAIGASVSGVPIWRAVALQGDVLVAVEVSGADSKASIAEVTGFLTQVLARV